MRWAKSNDENVIGYSVYRGEERLNDVVITDCAYRVARDVVIRPVLRGGYETMYSSREGGQGRDRGKPAQYSFSLTPNPFVGHGVIHYGVPQECRVEVVVYDIAGRCVRTLVSGTCAPGYYEVGWTGDDDRGLRLASGIYFVILQTGDFRSRQKIVLLP